MSGNRPDVVVVGAGPVGLVAACELARHGVAIRIIDKLTAPTTESRAVAVHARSLEMFDRMGITGQLVDSGVKTLGMQLIADGRTLAKLDLDRVDSAFPFSVTTPQTETEFPPRPLASCVTALTTQLSWAFTYAIARVTAHGNAISYEGAPNAGKMSPRRRM
jgi:threonine dehydrogenase-like Zn-dependent dehydrogenase